MCKLVAAGVTAAMSGAETGSLEAALPLAYCDESLLLLYKDKA
jgi:hypothetical protein